MHFSVAALLPLALAVPALSASVQARDDSYGGVDYNNNDGHKDDGKKDYDNKDYGKDYDNKDYGKDYDNKDNGRGDCTWTPVFEHNNDFKGWNKGKYTPYDHKEVDKITFEIGKRISSPLSMSLTSSPQSARASARRMTSVTLARVRLMFTPAPESSNVFSF